MLSLSLSLVVVVVVVIFFFCSFLIHKSKKRVGVIFTYLHHSQYRKNASDANHPSYLSLSVL